MFKFVFAAFVCVAMSCPSMVSAQDCGCCEPAPTCVKTRKRLKLVDVSREVCRLKAVCVTDECGCTKRKLVRVKECVSRKRLALVDVPVDPCKRGCLGGLVDRLRSRMARPCCDDPCAAAEPCCEPAPAPCCEPAPVAAPCCN